ncbi:MAG: nucleoside deaminase [Planctomycetota bacterium]|nr:nucleoside deaminase [Planctomycetota bacterium]
MNNKKFMTAAIKIAAEGIVAGQTPFGACITRDDEIITVAHNVVWSNTDITAHAEIQAIRAACRKLNTIDLTGCVIYSTCEPCPMCLAACHWAKISKIVFGARIADAEQAGFSELTISNEQMKTLGHSGIEIVGDFLRDECIRLFETWASRDDRQLY